MKSSKKIIQNKYLDKLSNLAKWKLLIIHEGIDCGELGDIAELKKYKTKLKNKIPTVRSQIFFDSSLDETLIPSEIYLSDGKNKVLAKFNYNPKSDFKLFKDKSSFYLASKKTKKIIDIKVYLVEKSLFENLIINNRPATDFIQILGQDRIGILTYEGCYHWNIGKSCSFCDSNPKRNWDELPIPSVNSLKKLGNEWWISKRDIYLEGIEDAMRSLLQGNYIQPHKHLVLMAGNLPTLDDIWLLFREVAQTLNRVKPLRSFDSYMNSLAPSENKRREMLEMIHYEIGIRNIQINLEVFGKNYFKKVCPGKYELVGYDNTLDALGEAAKIFGHGHSRTNFVLGAQPIKKTLEGVLYLAEKGVASDYSIFIPKKYTIWENKSKPLIDDVAWFSLELDKIYKRYGFKPIYCELSSRSEIANEVYKNI